MSRITLKDIRKAYGHGPAVLHGVSMDIEPGEFIVIVGPSGCGKSTLLRLIAGLEACPDGDIIINGKRANTVSPQDRDIAMIFQNYALYPHMTVRENIAFGLELRGMGRKERNVRAETVARTLELGDYLDRKPAALSGGQRQRVAMGRAIARETSTFLMDEPLSNLDNALRVTMRREIKELHQSLKATIIYVTHDQTEALSLADRIAVMKGGYLQQFDTPEAIYDRPANRFVASFIGAPEMNFFEASRLPEAGIPDTLTVGLRSDALRLVSQRPEGAALPATITLSEMIGSDVVLHCETPAGRVTLTEHRSTLPADLSNCWIACDMNAAHFFDSQRGDRVEFSTVVQ
ncbi:ABC transporter ATP-binding protein [Rhizobium sp. NRK18]|uniref:ABC transporter ATP-binding protein n=1 Tax=Rhizobium sp. NRK18 TaxID=2964667 RepID=UPI0021C36280|nr:ATP-binding cassette domain-containing protein [Rhizobium sp. NRK18]MCQ2006084.1 ATP-binding cassette domain-containing protein [Rhizobium sp. NRK18]